MDAVAKVLGYQVGGDACGDALQHAGDRGMGFLESLVMTHVGDDSVVFLYLGDGRFTDQCLFQQRQTVACEGRVPAVRLW